MDFDYCAINYDDTYNVIKTNDSNKLQIKSKYNPPDELRKIPYNVSLNKNLHKKSKSSVKISSSSQQLHSLKSPQYKTIHIFNKSKKFLSNPELSQVLFDNKTSTNEKLF